LQLKKIKAVEKINALAKNYENYHDSFRKLDADWSN